MQNPQEVMDEVFNILSTMGVNEKEKAEFFSYQLKDLGSGVVQNVGRWLIKRSIPDQLGHSQDCISGDILS